jgi:hypothetical protein
MSYLKSPDCMLDIEYELFDGRYTDAVLHPAQVFCYQSTRRDVLTSLGIILRVSRHCILHFAACSCVCEMVGLGYRSVSKLMIIS